MQKYKRHKKYPGIRSIPLRSPRRIAWHYNWDNKLEGRKPEPVGGPTQECFDGTATWVSIQDSQVVRVSGESDGKPRYVVIERRSGVELRLYWMGHDYCYVELYWRIGKLFVSNMYRGRDAAILAHSTSNIRWKLSRPLSGGDLEVMNVHPLQIPRL